jgi:hypothetical protein
MKVSHLLIGLFLIIFMSIACKTDDVDPIFSVSLSASANSILEDEGTVQVIATLSEPVGEDVLVSLSFNGSASNGFDYTPSDVQILIPANASSAAINLSAIQDSLEEYGETIEISISNVENATFLSGEMILVLIEDDDVPFKAQIIVNEILYDPSNSGLEGDANGDGVYSPSEDEFIEFINLSSQAVDISGYQIYDEATIGTSDPRHLFPSGSIIPPGGVFVVFGGGTPVGSFGGAIVQISSTGNLNLSNAGDVMTLIDTAGFQIARFDIEPLSDNPNESYTRNPDISGDFEQHSENTSLFFSPGTKIDGTTF